MHDVGKIGIPDTILLKPARLDERETAAIRQHPTLGAQIVTDLLDPEQVQWIHSHHERPDGAGYPDGLRASEIPLGAALIAVADAWDAMTVSRVYADAREPGDALAKCVRLAGRQFDLDVVEALRTVLAPDAHAAERTRTSTGLPPQAPEACASTNSATAAGGPVLARPRPRPGP